MNSVERLREKLNGYADAFLSFDAKTGFYLSGFYADDASFIVTCDSAVLFTDSRYIEAAEKGVKNGFEAKIPKTRMFEDIANFFSEKSVKKVAIEDAKLPLSEYKRLEERYPNIEFVFASSIISKLCEVKSNEELKMLADAQAVGDAAFAAVLPLINGNMTEIELAAELEYQMKKRGASGPSFETIAISGPNTSKPHGVPQNIKLHNNSFITMDFGCVLNGYCSDMTRTVVLGKADEEMKKMYNTVLEAQTKAIEFVRAGVSGGDCDKVARDIIYNAGYKGYFGHSLGHGVGLYIHESPRLSPSFQGILEVGNVVTVEPGIYIPGKYGVRIEDMMEITENGPVDITHSPKQLIEI